MAVLCRSFDYTPSGWASAPTPDILFCFQPPVYEIPPSFLKTPSPSRTITPDYETRGRTGGGGLLKVLKGA